KSTARAIRSAILWVARTRFPREKDQSANGRGCRDYFQRLGQGRISEAPPLSRGAVMHAVYTAAGKVATRQAAQQATPMRRCPLWVKSGHCGPSAPCPLCPRKRT